MAGISYAAITAPDLSILHALELEITIFRMEIGIALDACKYNHCRPIKYEIANKS